MAIGERIRFIRNLRGMTQKYLGMLIGFNEKNADVRMAQYESCSRTPKEDVVTNLAEALEVSPRALTVPNIDNYACLMHTLFALEDLYGLRIDKIDDVLCLSLDKRKGNTYLSMFDMFSAWQQKAEKLKDGDITKEEYDQWRYRYPEFDATQRRAKVLSQDLSDYLVDALKENPD